MTTFDLDPAALLKVAAQVACEYGCEVRVSRRGAFSVRPLAARPTSTDRVRRHRENKRLLSQAEPAVKSRAFEQCKTSSDTATRNETPETLPESAPSCPSLPPSPPSPVPPSSTPALTPVPPPARKGRLQAARRLETENNLHQAQEVPLPAALDTAEFRTLWADWCCHRAALTRLNPQKQWTALAARNTLAECARHGLKTALEAIPCAIANGWQSLVWERLTAPRGSGTGGGFNRPHNGGNGIPGSVFCNKPRPRNQAYLASEATLGLTADQISKF
jgi:hypothetical protein